MDWGWAAFKSVNFSYAYVINGEEYTAEGFTVEAEQAVLDAITALKGNNGSRFMGGLPTDKLTVGENTVQFIIKLDEDITQVIREYKVIVTEKVTEAPTEPPTEAPTEEPTEAPTEAPTETPTEAPAMGCGSALGLSALGLMALCGMAVVLRKKY